MSRRTKLILAGTALLAILGLSSATYAWFIALNQTPPGVVRSALVRCLPERGPDRDTASLLTYGSLISGSSVGDDGIPQVLPGDCLLSTQTVSGGVRTVRTSLARAVQAGETPGTEIHREERYGAGTAAASQSQRHLMNAYERDNWYPNAEAGGDPLTLPEGSRYPDGFEPGKYSAVTTAKTTVVPSTSAGGQKVTTTTVTLKTVYTPLTGAGTVYSYVHESVEEVTEESPTYAPSKAAFDTLQGDALLYTLNIVETVQTVDDARQVTRCSLLITLPAQGAADADTSPIPLALGNLSTSDVNIRVGLNATITRTGRNESGAETKTVIPLVLKTAAGAQFLGLESAKGFVELFQLKLAGTGAFGWTSGGAAEGKGDTSTAWNLFDLKLSPSDSVDIRPPENTPESTASPGPTASPAPTSAPAETEPDRYTFLTGLEVASVSHFGLVPADFEAGFNELYCTNAPIIDLRVHYYVRQSAYMEWSEFYSESLSFKAAVS